MNYLNQVQYNIAKRRMQRETKPKKEFKRTAAYFYGVSKK